MGLSMGVFDILKERGYVYQSTNIEAVEKILNSTTPITFYLGIDPTADSLHIGHFFALMMFKYMQDAGHRGIIVIGGATALVGDPSGRSDMRKMLTKEEVKHNIEEVLSIIKRFVITDGKNKAIILDNADWINPYGYIDFLRDIGIHFNINKMLATDAYANRLKEGGLTFLEMGYMLMQAYDFVYLNREYGCTFQIGGSDQWGNIVAGTTLNRKRNFIDDSVSEYNNDIFGLTCPLLLTKEGKKMGKTATGTLWVAREKTTPYDFYQYFYNVDDADTDTLLRLFTRIDLSRINELVANDIVQAKQLMAYEITKLVHGQEEADKVIEAVESLFKNKTVSENVPSVSLGVNLIEKGLYAVDIAFASGFFPSKSEARRMIEQGGFFINNEKINSVNSIVSKKDVIDGYILLKKGKKNFLKVFFV
jgi:tyrosyl-tRNA synthetase